MVLVGGVDLADAWRHIFDEAQSCIATREKIFWTISSWQGAKEGRDVLDPAFRKELEEHVAARLAAER